MKVMDMNRPAVLGGAARAGCAGCTRMVGLGHLAGSPPQLGATVGSFPSLLCSVDTHPHTATPRASGSQRAV